MSATSWNDITATPTQAKEGIVFTAGSTVQIDAPADTVFNAITSFSKYGEWNSWNSAFTFEAADKDVTVGSKGTLKADMEAQGKEYSIPVEILTLSRQPEEYTLAWQGQLMPTWVGKAERVQTVKAKGSGCEVQSWESMSGAASYVFKHVMGVPAQLNAANVRYLNDLKAHVEKGSKQ